MFSPPVCILSFVTICCSSRCNNVCFQCCSLATDFLPTFMYCMGSGSFDVVQTALRNLPEYVLLCQGKRILFSQILVDSDLIRSSYCRPCQSHLIIAWPCNIFSAMWFNEACTQGPNQSHTSIAACCNVLFFLLTEHADILLHKAFLVGIYGQIDTSSMISESMKVLHMEATT